MPAITPVEPLSRATEIDAQTVDPPEGSSFDLPEKILQFGTGAFLRGFADVFVDNANRKGTFNGRIVVVGSTGSGRAARINAQDGLYTICVQGIENGETVDRCAVVASVSRAMASTENWSAILDFARSPALELVFSNTTEVGIQLDADDRADLNPPRSFPGKLTAVLYERGETFGYHPSRGLTILCCELIEDNADKLRSIILELAARWELGDAFETWIREHNQFCNTLVDRIVPGKPDSASMRKIDQRLGYRDDLLIQAEPYYLWAIQGDAALRDRIGFIDGEDGILVTPDITPYRVRKVRILNGTHTAMVPVSFLSGNDTVAESMQDAVVSAFIRHVMMHEIVPSLDMARDEAEMFAHQVLDRFANPFVHHELMSIALQQTTKVDVRVLPSLHDYHTRTGRLPQGIVLAFAANLLFVTHEGRVSEVEFPMDDRGSKIRAYRNEAGRDDVDRFVRAVCTDRELWHLPLDELPEFIESVASLMREIQRIGTRKTLEIFLSQTNRHP
jgi:tagaturonate reductase